MRNILILFFLLIFTRCSEDRSILPITDIEAVNLEEFQKMDSTNMVVIAGEKEPGERLILCLTFLDKNSKKPVSNKRVNFYHTSTNGEYEPTNPNDETTARLNGTGLTNEYGNVYVNTILPGDYGSSENNRHIHTTVFGAKPEFYDIFFNQYSGEMGKFMNSGNDQMFFADLRKTKDSILISFVTIEVKNTSMIN